MSTQTVSQFDFESNPAGPVAIPEQRFARKVFIKEAALRCDRCGKVSRGRSVQLWTECPRCRADVKVVQPGRPHRKNHNGNEVRP